MLCVFSSMPATAQVNSAPIVAIDSGRISGSHFGSSAHQVMFLGIPYAAPPIHEQRWRPPVPVEPWKGVRKADAFAPACPQPANSVRAQAAETKELSQKIPYYRDFRTDEDCLYLNVWTTNLAGKQKLPVMVWIHGGGGFSGNSWTALGPSLAPNGVVLVSVGFRIGALGHLAHPLLTEESPHHASGNYGSLDQIAALHWVQRNIAAFGGDSSNVTIFGGSDGAQKVCLMMASPLARGLFHHAILESGVCSNIVIPELKKSIRYEGNNKGGTAEDTGIRLAHALKIPDGANMLAGLRSKTGLRRKPMGGDFSGHLPISCSTCKPRPAWRESDYAQHTGIKRLRPVRRKYIRTTSELLGRFALATPHGCDSSRSTDITSPECLCLRPLFAESS